MTHQARALFFRLIRLPICQEILEGSPAQGLGVVEGELQHCVDSVAIKMGFIRHPAPHANVFISLWRNQRNMSEVFHKLNLFIFQYDCHFFPSWGKSYKAVASLLSRCENMRSLLKRDSDCTRRALGYLYLAVCKTRDFVNLPIFSLKFLPNHKILKSEEGGVLHCHSAFVAAPSSFWGQYSFLVSTDSL